MKFFSGLTIAVIFAITGAARASDGYLEVARHVDLKCKEYYGAPYEGRALIWVQSNRDRVIFTLSMPKFNRRTEIHLSNWGGVLGEADPWGTISQNSLAFSIVDGYRYTVQITQRLNGSISFTEVADYPGGNSESCSGESQ
jgi:hypothetical protein